MIEKTMCNTVAVVFSIRKLNRKKDPLLLHLIHFKGNIKLII